MTHDTPPPAWPPPTLAADASGLGLSVGQTVYLRCRVSAVNRQTQAVYVEPIHKTGQPICEPDSCLYVTRKEWLIEGRVVMGEVNGHNTPQPPTPSR